MSLQAEPKPFSFAAAANGEAVPSSLMGEKGCASRRINDEDGSAFKATAGVEFEAGVERDFSAGGAL